MTGDDLKMEDALFLGRLEPCVKDVGFTLYVWCPHCKREHEHCWDLENKLDEVTSRVSHCGNGPLVDKQYYVGLLPYLRTRHKDFVKRMEKRKKIFEMREIYGPDGWHDDSFE